MWEHLNSTDFCILSKLKDTIGIYVTDFVKIWRNHYSSVSFLSSLKESNMSLEIEESELVSKAMDMLGNVDTVKKVHISFDTNDTLTLEITKSYGFPVKLKLSLTEGSKELFFEKVSYPLLKTTYDLKRSQTELCQLLLKKDKEIKEYKDEGGRIALRHLKTPLFNEVAHLDSHRSYKDNFGLKDVPLNLLDRKLIECTTTVKVEPCENSGDYGRTEQGVIRNIKSEPPCSSTNTGTVSNHNGDIPRQDKPASDIKQELHVPDMKQEPASSQTVKSELSSQPGVSPRKKKKVFKL